MSKTVLVFGALCCAVIAINAFPMDDMETAASDKKESSGKEHYDEHNGEGGEKSEKGWEFSHF